MTLKENDLCIFISSLKDVTSTTVKLERDIEEWLQVMFDSTKVPILKKDEDFPYSHEDFSEVPSKSAKHLKLLTELLESLIEAVSRCKGSLSPRCVNNIAVQCTVLAAQYRSSSTEWGSVAAANNASKIFTILFAGKEQNTTGLDLLESRETSQSLRGAVISQDCQKETGICLGRFLKPILQYLTNNFVKELWKSNPGAREVYLWLLYMLPGSVLSEHLSYLLPGALMMLDDWEQRHKITAMEALDHVLQNVAGSELRCYGRASVIYEATKHSLYSREPDILTVAYPVTVRAAAVVQADPSRAHTLQITASEEVLSMLLREMAYEQRLDLRRVFADSLAPAVTATGITAVRWTSELLEVITNYLTTYDGDNARDRINVLKVVEVLVAGCWCRVAIEAAPLLMPLVQLLYDITTQDCTQQATEELLSRCSTIVGLLYSAEPQKCREVCQGLQKVVLPIQVKQNIERVFSPVFIST